MSRKQKRILYSESDIISLTQLADDASNPRLALRAQMVLQCLQGRQVKDIAADLNERPNTVIFWRNRFELEGIPALSNRPRGVYKDGYGSDVIDRINEKLADAPPNGRSRWNGELLSIELNVPAPVVRKHLRNAGICLRDVKVYTSEPEPEPEAKSEVEVDLNAESDVESALEAEPKVVSETESSTIMIPLQLNIKKEDARKESEEKDKMDLEIVVRLKDDGNIIEKTLCFDKCLPNTADFDLSTRKGFLRDFDSYETAVLEAFEVTKKEFSEMYFEDASKKKDSGDVSKRCSTESRLCRFDLTVYDELANSLTPKERMVSQKLELLLLQLCTDLSFRKAVKYLNESLSRTEENKISLITLSEHVTRTGEHIQNTVFMQSKEILEQNNFDPETGKISNEEAVSKFQPCDSDDKEAQDPIEFFKDEIEKYNAGKLPFDQIKRMELVAATETSTEGCVYISIDDVGVKHQKEKRKNPVRKKLKYVENTVIHIQADGKVYVITAYGMEKAFKMLLAFLLNNNLLSGHQLYFFTDGATNIRDNIKKFFEFRPYVQFLDWYHLRKKTTELLSQAVKGNKEARLKIRHEILKKLWVGNTTEAIISLESLPSTYIKNSDKLKEVVAYIERKKEYITCYALRSILNYRNSSNPAEKANDILVADRQKHNGMSWSFTGSTSLASIKAATYNGYLEQWLSSGTVNLSFDEVAA